MIRRESPGDTAAIALVLEQAFGRLQEAILVDRLRGLEGNISLCALHDGEVIGYLFLSPVSVETQRPGARLAGLGPMGVLPGFQKKGFGSALMQEGLDACFTAGYDGVVVLGHPEYYTRFGFLPASKFGLMCPYEVPDPVFMAQELRKSGLDGCKGIVRYPDAFDAV